MSLSLNKNIKILISIIAGFLIINLLLLTPLTSWLIRNFSKTSYFYLMQDWETKISWALSEDFENQTVFIGSSRTAYGVNPALSNIPVTNLGLIGASLNEMKELVKALKKKNKKIKTVYLEINPMSFTQRHMNSMMSEDRNNLFTLNFLDFYFPTIKKLLGYIPVYKNRYILRDIISDNLQNKNVPRDDAYESERKELHIKEHGIISSYGYQGFLNGSSLSTPEHQEKFKRECFTMIRWSLSDDQDDLSNGMRIFRDIVTDLQELSENLILWMPPGIKGENYGERFDLRELISKEPFFRTFKMIDLTDVPEINSHKAFIDCIHPTEETARQITQTLLQN